MKLIYWLLTRIGNLLCRIGNRIHKLVPNKKRRSRR